MGKNWLEYVKTIESQQTQPHSHMRHTCTVLYTRACCMAVKVKTIRSENIVNPCVYSRDQPIQAKLQNGETSRRKNGRKRE